MNFLLFQTNTNLRLLIFFTQTFRNNSARELSAFAESAMAVNRVVLQHMSINMMDEDALYALEELIKESEVEANKENIESSSGSIAAVESTAVALHNCGPENSSNCCVSGGGNGNCNKLAEKRKAQLPPFGLSPPSESKLIQRRSRQQSSQSLNLFSCRNSSKSTKNSCDYLVADLVSPCNYVESPGC